MVKPNKCIFFAGILLIFDDILCKISVQSILSISVQENSLCCDLVRVKRGCKCPRSNTCRIPGFENTRKSEQYPGFLNKKSFHSHATYYFRLSCTSCNIQESQPVEYWVPNQHAYQFACENDPISIPAFSNTTIYIRPCFIFLWPIRINNRVHCKDPNRKEVWQVSFHNHSNSGLIVSEQHKRHCLYSL